MKIWKLLPIIIGLAIVAQGQEHVHPHDDSIPPKIFRTDKANQVSFNTDMVFGKEVLRKGRYVIAHRVEAQTHWISFVPPGPEGKRVEVEAKTVPTIEKVSRIEILGFPDGKRFEIVRINIPGETVDHLF